jgi:hypothetical protein
MGDKASLVGSVGTGALLGGTIGSFIPVVGTGIGAAIGGGAGLISGLAANSNAKGIDDNVDYKDLTTAQKVALSSKAKMEGNMGAAASMLGMEDLVGTQNRDRLESLKNDHIGDIGLLSSSSGEAGVLGQKENKEVGNTKQIPSENKSEILF